MGRRRGRGVETYVEVAAGLVASRCAVAARAHGLLRRAARVGSIGSRVAIGLPNVHLVAASTHSSGSGVGVRGGWSPAYRVGLYARISNRIQEVRNRFNQKLTRPSMNLRSWGHWLSQYPVPYPAPAALVGNLFLPPSASI